MPFPQNPWALYGIISGAGFGVIVTVKNNTKGETQIAETAADSSFLIDAANFASGYTDGDEIAISVPGYPDKTVIIDVKNYPEGIGIYVSKPSPYDIFAWPYILNKSMVMPGYTSQVTGEWIPESLSDMIINGHITDISIKELQNLEPGVFSIGDRKITLDKNIGLTLGDFIKVTEDSAGTETMWYVKAKQNTSALINKHASSFRETFLLKRKIE